MVRLRHPALVAFGGLVATLAAIASFLGVFSRGDGSFVTVTSVRGITYEMATNGVYANNAKQLVAEGVGWDVFTLFVAVPATFAALWFVGRGSFRARLAVIGMFGYLFYQYLEYAMTWAFGPLFPVFIAIYAGSLIGIVAYAASIARDGIEHRFSPDFPRRPFVVLNVAMSALLAVMWTARIATGLSGDLASAGIYGETTLVVQALDLGVVIPVALFAALLVWRRVTAGYAVAAAYVISALAMSGALVAMMISASIVNDELALPPIVIFSGFVVGFGWVARRIYRGVAADVSATQQAHRVTRTGAAMAHGHTRA